MMEHDMLQWEQVDDMDEVHDTEGMEEADETYTGQNNHDMEVPGSELELPRAEASRELATIPQADTPSRRSKRRADTADAPSLERAKQIKVVRNLDSTTKKGNNTTPQASSIQRHEEW
jgi:hypothetical protein